MSNSKLHTVGEDDIGVLINGVARIGKTFLPNALAGSSFESRRSAEAVTSETDSAELGFEDGGKLVFLNIPGLIEAHRDNMERNTEEVRKAFMHCPQSVVVYVFKDVNGSVSGEAVAALRRW